MEIKLPVPVLSTPHWRINFRPDTYNSELIPSLSQCFQVVEQTRVGLRGWDYPHLSNRENERAQGTSWIASWTDFGERNEYWRLYQSGQFIHLFSIEEATNPEWRKRLEAVAKGQLGWGTLKDFDWSSVPGFISILNFLYTVTEVFEFAARLCEKGVYRNSVTISIRLAGIKGFVLAHEWNRPWYNYYRATEDMLERSWDVHGGDLLADSAERSLSAALWFFERFAWMNPSVDILRRDQENFLRRRI